MNNHPDMVEVISECTISKMNILIPAFLLILGDFSPPPAPPYGDVSTFLENIDLEEYTTLFEQEDISYKILSELMDETLQTIGYVLCTDI